MNIATKIELHTTRLDMVKAVHSALCDEIEDLNRAANDFQGNVDF
jgi:hypothetical protein